MDKEKKYLTYFINLCTMLSFIIVIASYVNHIELFKGEPQIVIKGIDYINKHEIVSKIDYNELQLFTTGIKKTQRNIETLNYVKSAKISFLLPNIYVIQIIERTPIFMATNNEYTKFY